MYALLFVAATLLAAVLIHELGHALACRTFDLRLDEFAVWPFHFRRVKGRWRLVRPSALGGRRLGLVGFYPLSGDRLRARLLWCIASGPLASIIVGGAAVLSAGWLERVSSGAAAFVGATGLWSLFGGFINLFPSRRPGAKSDGGWLFDLARGKAGIVQLYAIKSLVASCDWLRPREWDHSLVQIALDEPADLGLPQEVDRLVHWVRYQWYADTGNVERAGEALEWTLRQDLSPAHRLGWAWDAVWFQAFSLRDAAGARAMQGVAQQLTPAVLSGSESIGVWKSKAGIAACEGRIDDASEAASNAVSFAKSDKSYAGLAKALEDDLAELIERFHAAAESQRP